jgi:hypothetical protein
MYAITRGMHEDKMKRICPELIELAERLSEDRRIKGKCLMGTFNGQNYCLLLRAPEPDFSCSEAGDDYVSVPEPTEHNLSNINRYRICRFGSR